MPALVAVEKQDHAWLQTLADRRSVDIDLGCFCVLGAGAGATAQTTAARAGQAGRSRRTSSSRSRRASSSSAGTRTAGSSRTPRRAREFSAAKLWRSRLSRPSGLGRRTLAPRNAHWPHGLVVGRRRRLVLLSAADGRPAGLRFGR